jgi:hypothetical protein
MRKGQRGIALLFAITAAVFTAVAAAPPRSFAASLLYKSYLVRKDGSQDILCDPYIVQPNDYVLKIFRERGEISQTDFPEFLRIFKRINPQIGNIDRILPGQHLFLPLKKLAPNSLPDQATGLVTIPYVTLSTIPGLLKENAKKYVLRRGDTVSGILSGVFGKYGTASHQKGMRIFKLLNPGVTNLDRVYAGQAIWLPTAALRNQPWYASLFDTSGRITALQPAPPTTNTPPQPPQPPAPPSQDRDAPLQSVARLLGAQLHDRGTYYFPRSGMADAKLNLANCPVLEFPDRRRTLIVPPTPGKRYLSDGDLSAIRSFWPCLSILPVAADSPVGHILDALVKLQPDWSSGPNTVQFLDRGVRVSVHARWWLDLPEPAGARNPEKALSRTRLGVLPPCGPNAAIPSSLVDYLALHGILLKTTDGPLPEMAEPVGLATPLQEIQPGQPEAFVAALATAMGLSYSTGVSISFPYCGMQIPAVTNLITTQTGRSILVDFGDFYGDAISAIEQSGLPVVCIRGEEPRRNITEKILTAAGLSYQADPTFAAPSRQGAYGVTVSVPGFLVNQASSRHQLLSLVPLAPTLVQWFAFRGLDIVQIFTQGMHS